MEFDGLLNRLSDIVGLSRGVLLTGSAAWSGSSPQSDMDLIVVTEDSELPSLLETTCSRLGQSHDPRLRYLDCAHSLKGKIDDRPMSFWVFSQPMFREVMGPLCNTVTYVRNTPNSGTVQLYNLNGELIDGEITNQFLGDGLFFAGEPNFVQRGGKTHIGVVPDASIKAPRILYDPNNFLSEQLHGLWDNILDRLYRETDGAYADHVLSTGKLHLIGKQTQARGQLYEHMKEQLSLAKGST